MATLTSFAADTSANVRKSLKPYAFLGPEDADEITALTDATNGGLMIPATYVPLGMLAKKGAITPSADESTSDVMAAGHSDPARTDITQSVDSEAITLLETNKETIALRWGVDPATLVPDTTSGELIVNKPATLQPIYKRLLVIYQDGADGNEYWVAKWYPRANVTKLEPTPWEDDSDTGDAVTVTFTGYFDDTAGTARRGFYLGAAFKNNAAQMGF